jgi:serine/threonine protein kinase
MSHSQVSKYETSFFFVLDEEKLIELYRTFPRTYTIQLDFHQLFKPVRRIGQGATSVVYQVVRFADKQPLAVKAFKKSTYYSVANGKGKVICGLCRKLFIKS